MVNKLNLYKAEWLDLVFKNRNQHYGAYVLRQQSAGITIRALLLVSVSAILLFTVPKVYRHFNPAVEVDIALDRIIDVALLPPAEPLKAKPADSPEPPPLKEKVKTVKFTTNIKVVAQPVSDVQPPTVEDIKSSVIGSVNQEGIVAPGTDVPVSGSGGTGQTATSGGGNDEIFEATTIDVYPEFEGGMKAWSKFIQRNLRYPELAQAEGIQGKVFISFVINQEGLVSDVKVIRGIGAGCDEEAIRVIKKSPRWKPGRQNNRNVNVRYQMPLSFTIAP